MNKFFKAFAIFSGVLLEQAAPAQSFEFDLWERHVNTVHFAAGQYATFDAEENENAAFEVEWRPGIRFAEVFQPYIGFQGSTANSYYGYFGFGADLVALSRYYLFPFVSFGGYVEGEGINLGSTVQFRSGAEAGIVFDSGWRVGVTGLHMSNAEITEQNPGVEIFLVKVGIPLFN